ncbi:hypothetical protein D3C78_1555690 [compost metagenome]
MVKSILPLKLQLGLLVSLLDRLSRNQQRMQEHLLMMLHVVGIDLNRSKAFTMVYSCSFMMVARLRFCAV